uniref:Uncharacterized protein n=1 Tax=Solanum lycopersicum TaxID=4081 RepID=A0A3Q7G713_SOLLC
MCFWFLNPTTNYVISREVIKESIINFLYFMYVLFGIFGNKRVLKNYAVLGEGPYWREMEKIVVLELLSNHSIQMFRHILKFEVKMSINTKYERWLKEKMNDSSNLFRLK